MPPFARRAGVSIVPSRAPVLDEHRAPWRTTGWLPLAWAKREPGHCARRRSNLVPSRRRAGVGGDDRCQAIAKAEAMRGKRGTAGQRAHALPMQEPGQERLGRADAPRPSREATTATARATARRGKAVVAPSFPRVAQLREDVREAPCRTQSGSFGTGSTPRPAGSSSGGAFVTADSSSSVRRRENVRVMCELGRARAIVRMSATGR
jgi:hypothetical protein